MRDVPLVKALVIRKTEQLSRFSCKTDILCLFPFYKIGQYRGLTYISVSDTIRLGPKSSSKFVLRIACSLVAVCQPYLISGFRRAVNDVFALLEGEKLITGVSGQPLGVVFKCQAV